jgi:hypothetical protein
MKTLLLIALFNTTFFNTNHYYVVINTYDSEIKLHIESYNNGILLFYLLNRMNTEPIKIYHNKKLHGKIYANGINDPYKLTTVDSTYYDYDLYNLLTNAGIMKK